MTPNLNENINNIQAKALEKDPILELFDVSNKYLQNLEKNISSFLKEHGININQINNSDIKERVKSYDGNIEGDKNHIEKIKKIQDKLEYKKNKIKKIQLTSNLISSLIQTNSKEYADIKNIFKELGKEDIFEKNKSSFLNDRRQEEKEFREELLEASKKINEVSSIEENYTKAELEAKNKIIKIAGELNIDISKLERKDLYNLNNLKKYENILATKIFEEQKKLVHKLSTHEKESSTTINIEKQLKENETLAEKFGIEKETNEKLGKYIELSMQSGMLPFTMMASSKLRKVLPLLPSVIGVGIWARLMHGSMSDKASALGETFLTIAPITGTIVAYKDIDKANTSLEKAAAWSGFAVSAGFDVFTVFLVATGIGAPAAVGTQALKVTAKESVKLGVKKLLSFFSKNVVEETPRAYGTLGEITSKYIKGKYGIIKDAIQKVGLLEFSKRSGQQVIKDSIEGMWNILSFKGIRELKYLDNTINKPFKTLGNKLEPGKIKVFEKLENSGFIKEGATNRLKKSGTIEEMKIILHESNKNIRPEDATTLDNESNYKLFEQNKSSSKLDGIIKQLDSLLESESTDPKAIADLMKTLKAQDEHIGLSMNTIKDIFTKINEINLNKINNEEAIKEIIKIYKENKENISPSLNKFIKVILEKLKNNESFSQNSGNYLLLHNRLFGKLEQNTEGLNDFYKVLDETGIKESKNGYFNNFTKVLENIEKRIYEGNFNESKSKELIKGYLDIIKNAEKTGWGTMRMGITETKNKSKDEIDNLKDKYGDLDNNNGYEVFINKLLETENGLSSEMKAVTINKIDFSLIHSEKILNNIINNSVNEIKNLYKTNQAEAIKIIDKLSEKKTKKLLVNILKKNENQSILNEIANNTNSNRDLLKLIKFLKEKQSIESRIVSNVGKNDQINSNIGEDTFYKNKKGKMVQSITREALDNGLRELSGLSQTKSKEAFDAIIIKYNGNDKYNLNGEYIKPSDSLNRPSDEEIRNFIKVIESYDVAAIFAKRYPKHAEEISKTIMESSHTSIEYKIKFLNEAKKINIKDVNKIIEDYSIKANKDIDEIINKIANGEEVMYSAIIKSLDNLENLFSKLGNNEILSKIDILKNSEQYKIQDKKVMSKFELFLDFDRFHNEDFLTRLKNSGEITYKTKNIISEIIKKGSVDFQGEIRELNKSEIKKLRILEKQIEKVLNKYEFNLFDSRKYKEFSTDIEKADYIYNIIDQHSGWKLSNGTNQEGKIVKLITTQINTLNQHFYISSEVKNCLISKILKNNNENSLNVGKKIHMLKLLEKTGLIKSSIEYKLDYTFALLPKNSQEVRTHIYEIKKYIGDFDKALEKSNKIARDFIKNNDTQGLRKYIESTISDRSPVTKEYVEKENLKENKDFIIIDNKYYITEVFPARAFVKRLINTDIDIKLKEAYMEIIADKSNFGEKSIKDYYNETKDIKTKILLSYHKDLKYEKESLDILKKYSSDPKYHELINYVIQKRDDLSMIKEMENGKINEEFLNQIITKEKLEIQTGKKYNESEFSEIKNRVIKILINTKDINKLAIISRGLADEGKKDDSKILSIAIKEISENKSLMIEAIKNNLYQNLQISVKGELDQSLNKIYNKLEILIKQKPEILNDDILLTSEITKILNDNISGSLLNDTGINKSMLSDEIKNSLTDLLLIGRFLISEEILNKAKEIGNKLNISENIANVGLDVKGIKLAEGKILNIKTLLGILITYGLMTPTQAEAKAQEINQTWETSPEHKQYQEYIKAGKIKEAMEIKKTVVNEITKTVLKDYIADFKDKYEAKYLDKMYDFPTGLSDLAAEIHEKGRPLLKDQSEKGRHNFVKALYEFLEHYNKEDGKATYFAERLLKKAPGIEETPFMDILNDMAKQSDLEAAKTPEQKQKEHEEYMKQMQREIDVDKREIGADKREIDADKREIDADKREIERIEKDTAKRQEIIDRLKSI